MRSSLPRLFLLLAPLALFSQAGCSACGGHLAAQDDQDLFGGLDVATEGSEMDSQAAKYLWARPTSAVILCVRAPCPSYEVRSVDGRESRLVHQFDLRALGLPTVERDRLYAKMGKVLARGRYAKARFQKEEIVVFQVTRALEPAGSGSSEHPEVDNYYRVTVSGGSPSDNYLKWQAKPLKGGAALTWQQMDLSPLGLEEAQQQALLLELRSRGGYMAAEATAAGIPRITQAFHAQ